MGRTLVAAALLAFAPPARGGEAPVVHNLPGLHAPATVVRDTDGIAHILGSDDHDVFFMNGYVHAEDRLFQIDVLRRQGSGTLAELLGQAALESDVQLRTFGVRRSAEATLAVLLPETVEILEAYAGGVNAWVSAHDLPPEYQALELSRFEPWTAVDSVVVGKIILLNLSLDLSDIERTMALASYQRAGEEGGFDGRALFFEDVFRAGQFDPASTVPDALGAASPKSRGAGGVLGAPLLQRVGGSERNIAALRPAALRLAERYLETARRVPLLEEALGPREGGSNQWVVAGDLSEGGYPILAHDPHLALGTPSTLYPVHLVTPELNVTGSQLPGGPVVVLGHNRWIAYAGTVNLMDQTDVYQEQIVVDESSPSGLSTMHDGEREAIVPFPESYRVNRPGNGVPDDVVAVPSEAGPPPASLQVPRRGGPIIELDMENGVALSLQYAGLYPTHELDMFVLAHRARSVQEFKEAMQFFDGGSQNWGCVDIQGNIAYFTSGELPLREDLQAGSVSGLPPYFIRDGRGGNDWLALDERQERQALPVEVLPFAEMPKLLNPPGGWFVNANNDAAGNTIDNDPLNQLRPGGGIFYFNHGYYARGFRAGRITALIRGQLERGEPFSIAAMQRIQSDTVLLDAEVFVPYILRAFDRAAGAGADPVLRGLVDNASLVEAVERLRSWDFTTPTGIREGYDASDTDGELSEPTEAEVRNSVAATIYAVWRGQVLSRTIDTTLAARGLPRPSSGTQAMVALRHVLDSFEANGGLSASGVDFFAADDVADAATRRDIVLLESLASALDLLAGPAFAAAFGMSADQDDYRWGRLHRIVFAHPLGGPFSVPPAGGAFPSSLEGLPGIATDGGYSTVDASPHGARAAGANAFMFSAGPAGRFVYEARRSHVSAVGIWPGGASGVVGNERYTNLLGRWLTNDTAPVRWSLLDLLRAVLQTEVFVPEEGPRGRQRPGDCNQDGDLNISDLLCFVRYLFGHPDGQPERLPCGDGGAGETGNLYVADLNGDRRVDMADAVYLMNLLSRGGPPPLFGTECVEVPGCGSAPRCE